MSSLLLRTNSESAQFTSLQSLALNLNVWFITWSTLLLQSHWNCWVFFFPPWACCGSRKVWCVCVFDRLEREKEKDGNKTPIWFKTSLNTAEQCSLIRIRLCSHYILLLNFVPFLLRCNLSALMVYICVCKWPLSVLMCTDPCPEITCLHTVSKISTVHESHAARTTKTVTFVRKSIIAIVIKRTN